MPFEPDERTPLMADIATADLYDELGDSLD